MKKIISILIIFTLCELVLGQKPPKEYQDLIKKAEALYNTKDYLNSANNYSAAFKTMGWKGLMNDRYNAACSWSLAGKKDSSFVDLNRLSNVFYFLGKRIMSDTDLISLHNDKRWTVLIKKITQAKDSAEANYNKPIVGILDTIYDEDQKYRRQLSEIDKMSTISKDQKGRQKDSIWKIIEIKDRINLCKVKDILDKYGWLGPDEIGVTGNSTLFLVIQHSDLSTQEKYLPIMREAVKNKKALPGDFALLVDRVAISKGKNQIYGSQVNSFDGQHYYLLPLENPDSVDIKRTEVGLSPLADYLQLFNIKWDLVEYKKNQEKYKGKDKIEFVKYPMDKNLFLVSCTILLLFIGFILICKRY